MTDVVIGAADQSVAAEMRTLLSEIEGMEVTAYLESTPELSASVAATKPEVAVLHDGLGPQTTAEVVRELVSRSPATAILVINSSDDVANAMASMEAGAKGVLSYPVAFDDLLAKLETAREWAQRMGELLAGAAADASGDLGRHGRVTVFAGAKGGVGATTVATHMAIDLQRRVPGIRVLLVDLDLQAGDLSGILQARQRVSIADVAKVSDDLSAATILDAVVRHESGVSLLLSPLQVHESDYVTPTAVRSMLSLLRQEFDVILVDGGSHATPAQAAAVEVADEVVVLVTPDVLAMRGFRRVVQAWEGLGVRTEEDLRVLVNRVSRDDVLNADALAKLTSASMVSTQLPSAFRRLEKGVNARDPQEIRETSWWEAMERIGSEVGVYAGSPVPVASAPAPERPKRRGSRRREKSETGQIAVETAALVPLVVVACLLAWQLGLTALAFQWNGNAANAAGRAAAIHPENPESAARDAARDALPNGLRDDVQVAVLADGSVRVSMPVPVVCASCGVLPGQISQTASVVSEP